MAAQSQPAEPLFRSRFVGSSSAAPQQYRRVWEDLQVMKGWLQPVKNNPRQAFCAVCKCKLTAHLKDLKKHASAKKHLANMKEENTLSNVVRINEMQCTQSRSLAVKVKTAEVRLAVYIAEHSAFNTSDHLTDCVQSTFTDSRMAASIRLHRSKCTALITKVVGPCMHKELVEDVRRSGKFSLIIDESTDVSVNKQMGIVIRYYSRSKEKVVSAMYALLHVPDGKAQTLSNAILSALSADELDVRNLIGLGVDGASANVGEKKSVSTLLKQHSPSLIVIRCTCHTLALAASKSAATLPRFLEFVIRETHTWFARSSIRRSKYEQLYAKMNGTNEKPLTFPALSETRWLSRYECTKRIASQWDTLLEHFRAARDKEKCEVAAIIAEHMTDANRLFVALVLPIIREFNRVNMLFQHESASLLAIQHELVDFYKWLIQKLVRPEHYSIATAQNSEITKFDFEKYMRLPDTIDFGYEFTVLEGRFKRDHAVEIDYNGIRFRGREFLQETCIQVRGCLPDALEMLDRLNRFDPVSAISQINQKVDDFAAKFSSDPERAAIQWQQLHLVHWQNVQSGPLPFWQEVSKYETAGGEKRHGVLADMVLALFALPISNADVERLFSMMNAVKSDLRNQLSTPSLQAVMNVRSLLRWRGQNCTNFEPSDAMLQYDSSMYDITTESVAGEPTTEPTTSSAKTSTSTSIPLPTKKAGATKELALVASSSTAQQLVPHTTRLPDIVIIDGEESETQTLTMTMHSRIQVPQGTAALQKPSSTSAAPIRVQGADKVNKASMKQTKKRVGSSLQLQSFLTKRSTLSQSIAKPISVPETINHDLCPNPNCIVPNRDVTDVSHHCKKCGIRVHAFCFAEALHPKPMSDVDDDGDGDEEGFGRGGTCINCYQT